ncbi:tetratricopeptide repeat protein [Colwellia sp. C1TZA3]|uniref:tetratricopeptide repeat protein n=1 Tax=Colwellia sp. C1TZA3 TaxID=2508879 RepID=UPI0011B9B87F|nr:tetratricopeptide repeat protein [Colwellia sp. C1TZA3]TWX70002.1 tetratricopeptide repeat protein [Colwellia sp. C1TZA3]
MRYTVLILSIMVIPFSYDSYASYDYEKAHIAFNASKIEAAYIHLKNALKNTPDDLPSQLLMAKILLQQHHYTDSASLYQAALSNGADINLILNELANALMLSKQYQQVIALNDSGKLNQNNHLQWLLLAANAYSALDEIAQAKVYLQQAYVIAPDNIKVLQSLSTHFLEQKEHFQASEKITYLLSLFPEDAKNWYLQGQLHIAKFEYKQALVALEKAYQLAPLDPFIQRALANIYTGENRINDALTITNLVLKNSPKDPFALLLKSRLLSNSHQEAESRLILDNISNRLSLLSEEDKQSNQSLLYVASVSSYVKGDFELAQTQLQAYLEDNSDDLFAINLLVSIYISQGQTSKAQATLENKAVLIKNDLKLSLQLVEIYLKNNQLFKAEQMLNNLPVHFQRTPDYLRAEALLLTRLNQSTAALTLLDSALNLDAHPKLLITKALILKENKNIAAAMVIADNLLRTDANNSDYLKLKSTLLLAQNKWFEALTIIGQILVIKPNDYTSLFNKASALALVNQLAPALTICHDLLARTPNASQVLILQAKINRDLGEVDQAVTALIALLQKEHSNISALETLLYIYIDQKNNIDAINLLDRLTKLSFLNPEYVRLKAQVYLALKDQNNSNKQIDILSSLAKSSQDFYALAELQAKANMLVASKMSLDQAISTLEDNSANKLNIEFALVNVNLILQDYAASNKLLNSIEQQHPKNSFTTLLRGHYYYAQQQFLPAQESYLKTLILDKKNSQALIKLYQLAQLNIKNAEFITLVTALLEDFPDYDLARNLLADHYLNNANLLAAKPHYEKLASVKHLKNQAAILNNLANILQFEDLEKARFYAKQAVEINSTSAAFSDTYAWIIAQQGDYDSALNLLRNAYAMDSNNPSITYHLAFILTKLKRNEEALTVLKKSLDNKSRFSERVQAEKLFQRLTLATSQS